jgi:hypothetical protein
VAAAHDTAQNIGCYPAIDLYSYIHKLRISSWLRQRQKDDIRRIVIVRHSYSKVMIRETNVCVCGERGDIRSNRPGSSIDAKPSGVVVHDKIECDEADNRILSEG